LKTNEPEEEKITSKNNQTNQKTKQKCNKVVKGILCPFLCIKLQRKRNAEKDSSLLLLSFFTRFYVFITLQQPMGCKEVEG
jgi:hypothetical protein